MQYVEQMVWETFQELDRLGCREAVTTTFVGDGDYVVLHERDGDRSAVFFDVRNITGPTLQALPTGCGASGLWRAVEEGHFPRTLEDIPLQERIFDLDAYVRDDVPGEAVQVAKVILARGGWIGVGHRVEGLVPSAVESSGPQRRYLMSDVWEVGSWVPATEEQAMDDLTTADGDAEPANAAVAAVVQLVQQLGGPPAEEDFDLQGAHVVYRSEAYMPVPYFVSFHASAAGAERAVLRRNEMDPGTLYEIGLRTDMLQRREAALVAEGV